MFDPARERRQLGAFSHDPLVSILSNLAWILLALGYPEQALARSEAAVDEARGLNHPVSLAVALHRSCQFRHLAQALDAVRPRVDELRHLADEHDLPFFRAFALAFAGSLLVGDGQPADGEPLIRDAIDIFDRTRITLLRPYVAAQRAVALSAAERPADALAVLDDARTDTERSGARWYEAEIWRQRAAILRSIGRLAEAEQSSERAIDIARRQQARLWELRAASLRARLWAEKGERQRATDLLAPIHAWFTEGHDSRDLVEAESLLNELR